MQLRSLKLSRITASAGFGTFFTLETLNFDEEFGQGRISHNSTKVLLNVPLATTSDHDHHFFVDQAKYHRMSPSLVDLLHGFGFTSFFWLNTRDP